MKEFETWEYLEQFLTTTCEGFNFADRNKDQGWIDSYNTETTLHIGKLTISEPRISTTEGDRFRRDELILNVDWRFILERPRFDSSFADGRFPVNLVETNRQWKPDIPDAVRNVKYKLALATAAGFRFVYATLEEARPRLFLEIVCEEDTSEVTPQTGDRIVKREDALRRAVALAWHYRMRRQGQLGEIPQAAPDFWNFLDEHHLEIELRQILATLTDDERARVTDLIHSEAE